VPHLDLAGLPGLGDIPEPLRVLSALGLTLFLVLLRFDAERFSAAEYDDLDRWGNPPSLLRRLAWYTLGFLGVLGVLTVHPAPSSDLFLGLGERLGVIILGLTYGLAGSVIAGAVAFWRYHHIRLPYIRSYPGAVVNAVATAFLDEAVFRGIVFGFLITMGTDPNLANVAQTLLYGLATRLGAPGRPLYMLLVALVIGLTGGWLTGITGGIGAAFLGHAITRLAIFLLTGHAGLPAPKGREVEDFERRQQAPDGWRQLGAHETDEP
jgi:hypothetical protein